MNINTIGNIPKIITKATGNLSFTKLPDMPNDVFIKSTKGINEAGSKLEDTLKKAFEFCRESVLRENPIESQMAFDSSGKVLYTNFGDENTVNILSEKLTNGATAIHSHPDACTFSIKDVMALVQNSNLKKIACIDPQGRINIMQKPEGFATPTQEKIDELYYEFCDTLTQHWKKAIGGVDNPRLIRLEENERRLMQYYKCDSVEELYAKLGKQKTSNLDENEMLINSVFYGDLYQKPGAPRMFAEYDSEAKLMAAKIDKVKATQEGINIGNQLMQKFANILGFKFESGQI